MTNPAAWFAPWLSGATAQTMGWTLVHFLWEGLALSLFLYVALAFFRSARGRYILAVCTLAGMLVAPLVTFGVLRQTQIPAVPLSLSTASGTWEMLASPAVAHASGNASTLHSIDWLGWSVCLWLGGVLLFSIRALGGWLVLARLRRDHVEPLSSELVQKFRVLEQRLGLARPIRYLRSKAVETPAVVGWFRPLVLMPLCAINGLSPEQLEAVVVHELAHIQRLDAFVNLFQVAAETLLFYHPSVWWVNRVIRAERENCCDDISVAVCGNATEYARALTILEQSRIAPAWALAANGGALKSRVMRLLKPQSSIRAVSSRALGMLGILCAAGVLMAATAVSKTDWHFAADEAGNGHVERKPAAPAAPTITAPVPSVAPEPAPAVVQEASAAPSAQSEASPKAEPAQAAAASGSYIDAMNSVGLKDLTINDLIALKVQGVTPDYVREIRASGFDPTAHDVIAMKVQGITPDYVKDIRATGLNPTLHDLVAMKVQDVTPSYIKAMQGAGLGELKVHDIIGMKVQGITPEYINGLKSAGFADLKAHDAVAAKVQGITPEYIEKVRSHGFKNLTLHQLIALKTADVF